MSRQAEAELILKLYDLRREHKMREARDWYFREFHPASFADIEKTMWSEHSGYLRMVMSYWDMAATLVNHGAIDRDFFLDANGEQFGVFAKLEPYLDEMRANMGPQMLTNLEKLIDAAPGGRERTAMVRERIKQMQERFQAMKSQQSAKA